MAYGHLDLLDENDVEVISRGELKARLAERPVENYFWSLLEETTDDDVILGILPTQFEDPSRRLFYSDPEVFEHYLITHSLPLLTFEDQSVIVMLTELPEHVIDLLTEDFWSKLVSPFDVTSSYQSRMIAL